ncbi:YTH domain-containing protein [Dioscorea alata]|uniref:YTH domain-containing protein n=6 Tax=Dioscorea alata TaxID=55571 RepID=A0ACB7W275_DIOAL|nr:YTH domain-containing protein [Dioscorea alata]KAH7681470.1 YTH domain-containing protein [Dioscorea alata]KAH7681471.1 YTH domain-containing protein [Dioscorea alata]KAH7681472.1 YTH domain-containing protein [Dioscorea alata]KAH7681473.1 YTH domain-containing protein [Dioscorea alata]
MAVSGQSDDLETCFSSVQHVQHTVVRGSGSNNAIFQESRLDVRNEQSGSKNSCGVRRNGFVRHPVTALNERGIEYRKSKSSADVNLIIPFNPKPRVISQRDSEVHHFANRYSKLGGIPPCTNQGQDMFSVRHSPGQFRSTRQAAGNKSYFKMSGNYSSYVVDDEASTKQARGPRFNKSESYVVASEKTNILGFSICRDNFNKSDFQTKYKQALFFMIKSYCEDNIHKSIKYSVWSSTPYGNKKLEDAYQNAEAESRVNGKICPIFLFFSVNSSGQFVGVAEMVGPVDFKKNLDFWQQNGRGGFFPVKWHIIKDIPNRHFKNITLENNDNKVVTFSRDTQEIGLPQGLNMLNIMKAYPLTSSILDDFDFYENREKSLYKAKSSEPVMLRSGVGFNKDTSLNNLERSFEKLDVCARPNRASFGQKSSFDFRTRNLPFNSQLGNK